MWSACTDTAATLPFYNCGRQCSPQVFYYYFPFQIILLPSAQQKMNSNKQNYRKQLTFQFVRYHLFEFGLNPYFFLEIIMKSQLKPRPQSKQLRTELRPTSRYVNSQQAMQTFGKGKAEQQNKSFQKAIALYMRAIMYDPNLFQAFCNMGSCYRALGRYLEARNQYRRAIEIKNDDAISHYNLANIERVIGNYQPSIQHYEFVINLKEEKGADIGSLYLDSLVNIGICYKNIELLQKAIEYYQRARKVDANDQVALYNHAMCIMSSLHSIRADIFQEVVKQKGSKAIALFNQLLSVSPTNQMVQFQLLRLSRIMDKSNQNINKAVSQLKNLLTTPNCTIKDEINEQLGFCLQLLQQYEASAGHFQKSMGKITEKRKSQIIDVNVYDQSETGGTDKQIITEEEGFKLLEEGQFQLLKKKIALIEDSNLYKHTLQIALYIDQTGQSFFNLDPAIDIYTKHFCQNNAEIPFDKISIEAHRVIGNLLSTQGKYKQSIKHFQHISNSLKNTEQKAKVLSSLGSDYEALGHNDKALQQYRLALESQPNSYEMVYNVGCILYEGGKSQESMQYFEKFLTLIQQQHQVDLKTKNLYIADCLITMASCTKGEKEYELHEKAANAIKQVESDTFQMQFDENKLLNFYLRWIDLLQQKLGSLDKKTEQYVGVKQNLLNAYLTVVENENCPDRDAILNNCATIYYQEKLYINALANFNQVHSSALSYNNLALTYLHLLEHYMALQCIYKAVKQDPDDHIAKFNFQVITWIYGIENQSRLSQKFQSVDEDSLVYRLQYGMALIDKVTSKLEESTQSSDQAQVDKILSWLLQADNLLTLCSQIEKIQLKWTVQKLKATTNLYTAGDSISPQMINNCLTKSNNIDTDFKQLIQNLKSMSSTSIEAVSSLLYLFVLTNKDSSSKIAEMIRSSYAIKKDTVTLDLDRRVTVTAEELQKEISLSSANDLIADLCSCECEFESKMVVLYSIISKSYYHSNFRKPLELEYHLPRHNELIQCNNTLSKLAFILINVLQMPANISPKGTNLAEMKQSVISGLLKQFSLKLSKEPSTTIKFDASFVPLTIYANFQTKQDCLAFLKELQKESSNKRAVNVSQHCDQIVVIVSGIVRVRCQWNQDNLFENTLRQLVENPLEPEIQAIMYLQSSLQILKKSSPQVRQTLEANELFRE